MTFDYSTLKLYAKKGERLGNWNGKPVFAASAASLEGKGSGAVYIVYDDDNVLVGRTQNGWKSYGTVSEHGSVNEYSSPRSYRVGGSVEAMNPKRASYPPVASAPGKKRNEPEYVPGYDRSEKPVGDVKTAMDVDAVLKKAREMTVADLLEGFNYGLDAAKG